MYDKIKLIASTNPLTINFNSLRRDNVAQQLALNPKNKIRFLVYLVLTYDAIEKWSWPHS
jgi:hypothetical protein